MRWFLILPMTRARDKARFVESDFLRLLVETVDLQHLARFADAEPLDIEVERLEVIASGDESSNLDGRGIIVEIGPAVLDAHTRLVGQTDADERASGALWTADEWRRQRAGRGYSRPPERIERLSHQIVVDRDANSLLGGDMVDDSFVALIAVTTEHQGLRRVGHGPHPRR